MKKIELTKEKSAALESVKEQFSTWRQNRPKRERIPEPLWAAAADLFHTWGLSVNMIAKSLRLNYSTLKEQISQREMNVVETVDEPSAMFIELNSPQVYSDCIIEIEKTAGIKMRLSFRGRADPAILDLGRHFMGGT